MNINASIVDQQLTGILEQHSVLFPEKWDDVKKRSAAFVVLCMAKCLDISLESAAELLTEGGNDAGVDGLYTSDVDDGEFLVTIFQGKYKAKLDGNANFPESAVQNAIYTTQALFNPSRELTLNPSLKPKIEEVRSLIREGYIPKVRIVLCNNGIIWNSIAQGHIDNLQSKTGDSVEFCHFNHDSIVSILKKSKTVDASLKLSAKMTVEDMNYMRVLIGRINVQCIYDLFEDHGNQLLEKNIRRYLGLHTNRVNSAILETLCSDTPENFYFYNNGVTIICDKIEYNALQDQDYIVRLKNMQIINGGQTCKTIHEGLKTGKITDGKHAYVMVRIYQVSEENRNFIFEITHATNSQNPVDLRDLHANDELQKVLAIGMKDLGYVYKSKRDDTNTSSSTIVSSIAAEAVLAIWREKPHQAKFRRKEHFGALYEDIFSTLNASQAILAVSIFRNVENKRKRPASDNYPEFLPYASHYIAMIIGRLLLEDVGIKIKNISHQNFIELLEKFQENEEKYYHKALQKISEALREHYGNRRLSLQQLAGTFRSGYLLEQL